MKKLDDLFFAVAKEKHPEAAYVIDTLAWDIRRLQTLADTYEVALKLIGRMGNPAAVACAALYPIAPDSMVSSGVAQLVAQGTLTPKVAGSSPAPRAKTRETGTENTK